MEYVGINMHTHYRHGFVKLMAEAGYKYYSLEELRTYLGAVLISTDKKGITEANGDLSYPWWNKTHQAALEMLTPEARVPYIIGVCEEHEQTRLSSREHLV